jgi:hypothetical protein
LLHVTLLIKDMLFYNILETNNVCLLLRICKMPDPQLLKRNKPCGTEHQTCSQRDENVILRSLPSAHITSLFMLSQSFEYPTSYPFSIFPMAESSLFTILSNSLVLPKICECEWPRGTYTIRAGTSSHIIPINFSRVH